MSKQLIQTQFRVIIMGVVDRNNTYYILMTTQFGNNIHVFEKHRLLVLRSIFLSLCRTVAL